MLVYLYAGNVASFEVTGQRTCCGTEKAGSATSSGWSSLPLPPARSKFRPCAQTASMASQSSTRPRSSGDFTSMLARGCRAADPTRRHRAPERPGTGADSPGEPVLEAEPTSCDGCKGGPRHKWRRWNLCIKNGASCRYSLLQHAPKKRHHGAHLLPPIRNVHCMIQHQ